MMGEVTVVESLPIPALCQGFQGSELTGAGLCGQLWAWEIWVLVALLTVPGLVLAP